MRDLDQIKTDLAAELERGFFVKRRYAKALGLTLSQASVYAVVRAFSERYPGGFSGSRGYIASQAGISEKSVSRAFAVLLERGFISRHYVNVNNRPHPAYYTDGSLEERISARYIDEESARIAKAEQAYDRPEQLTAAIRSAPEPYAEPYAEPIAEQEPSTSPVPADKKGSYESRPCTFGGEHSSPSLYNSYNGRSAPEKRSPYSGRAAPKMHTSHGSRAAPTVKYMSCGDRSPTPAEVLALALERSYA